MAWGTKQASYLARGVAPAYGTMRTQPAAAGRFIDAEDVRLQRRVVFLGSEVALKLFGNQPAVGETVRINGMAFEVVGVQKEKVQLSNYGRPDKESVFIPYTTAGQLWNTEYLSTFIYQAMDPTLDARTDRQVKELLGKRLRFNPADERALRIFGSAELTEITGGIVLGLKLVLAFIGVLTLAIGGVGVMNIMFVSVTERTREIGLRKALGARRRAILGQFLLEGLATTFAGGAVGVVLSYAAGVAHQPAAVPVGAARRQLPHRRHPPDPVVRAAGGLHRDPGRGRAGQLVRARAARVPPGSDRSAALRVSFVDGRRRPLRRYARRSPICYDHVSRIATGADVGLLRRGGHGRRRPGARSGLRHRPDPDPYCARRSGRRRARPVAADARRLPASGWTAEPERSAAAPGWCRPTCAGSSWTRRFTLATIPFRPFQHLLTVEHQLVVPRQRPRPPCSTAAV